MSQEDRTYYIYADTDARKLLTDTVIDKILDNMATYLRINNFDQAILVGLVDIGNALQGKSIFYFFLK